MEHLTHLKEEIKLLLAFPTIRSDDPKVFSADRLTAFGHLIGDTTAKASLLTNEGVDGVETLNINGVVGIASRKLGPHRLGVSAFFSLQPKGDKHQANGDDEEK